MRSTHAGEPAAAAVQQQHQLLWVTASMHQNMSRQEKAAAGNTKRFRLLILLLWRCQLYHC
jgi:hypothetical protein